MMFFRNKSGIESEIVIDPVLQEQYRHEYKYLIDTYQVEFLKHRLPTVMNLDSHASNGFYQIRSLYFDDSFDTCYYDNENGTDPREKFRVRIYNGSAERLQLELKRKEAGKTLKKSCPISQDDVRALLEGQPLRWDPDMNPILRKLYILQQTRGMRPKVIVEYDRIPFVLPEGNVRVTLDLNVRTSPDIGTFLNEHTNCRPIMPLGRQLLEVKFDQFLPDYIKHTVNMKYLQQTTFSKYYLCRKFGGIQ